jgi:hypothetical protein
VSAPHRVLAAPLLVPCKLGALPRTPSAAFADSPARRGGALASAHSRRHSRALAPALFARAAHSGHARMHFTSRRRARTRSRPLRPRPRSPSRSRHRCRVAWHGHRASTYTASRRRTRPRPPSLSHNAPRAGAGECSGGGAAAHADANAPRTQAANASALSAELACARVAMTYLSGEIRRRTRSSSTAYVDRVPRLPPSRTPGY